LRENYHKINWFYISSNPAAIDIVLENLDKISTRYFNLNPHPKAIQYFKQNPDKIDWILMSMNPGAEELIVKNLDKVDWIMLSKNPCIFKYNVYECATVKRTHLIKDELLATAFHPTRVSKYYNQGYNLNEIF